MLYGDGILYDERVFHGGEGEEDKVYTDGRATCDGGWDSGKCVAGRGGVMELDNFKCLKYNASKGD